MLLFTLHAHCVTHSPSRSHHALLFIPCRNVRPDYLNAIWNVINFNDVAKRLAAAKKA
jgi:superoxide dismutase